MRYIKKQPIPPLEWQELPNSYKKFKHNHKNTVRHILTQEQGDLCCYCGSKIIHEHNYYHMEHFQPKSLYPDQDANYYNLFLVCGHKRDPKAHHCDTTKADQELKLNILDPHIETRFCYTPQGEIHTTTHNDHDAEHDINILKLNHDELTAKRSEALDQCKSYINKLRKKQITPAQIKRFLLNKYTYPNPNQSNELPAFYHVINSFYNLSR